MFKILLVINLALLVLGNPGNPFLDSDGDGISNGIDLDDDNDGVFDEFDLDHDNDGGQIDGIGGIIASVVIFLVFAVVCLVMIWCLCRVGICS